MPVLPSSDGTTNPIERRAAPADRISPTLFTVASMSCMLALSYMLGSRARHLRLHSISRMNFVRKIVVLMYVVGIMFIATMAILSSGWGTVSKADCHAAIIICVAFYLASKFLLYLFLVERAHVIRAPSTRRLSDKVWLFSMAVVCLGFTGLAIVAFLWPSSEISTVDGKCRVGLLPRVTIPLLSFDIVINIGFTVLFVCLLWPLLTFHSRHSRIVEPTAAATTKNGWLHRLLQRRQEQPRAVDVLGEKDKPRRVADAGNGRLLSVLRKLVIKTVIGGVLTMLPTTANLTLLYIMKNHEQGWLCATVCSLDITWGIIIVHWLTVDPADLDDSLGTATIPPSNASSAKSATTTRIENLAATHHRLSRSSNGSVHMPDTARPSLGFLDIPGCGAAPLAKSTTVVTASDGSDVAESEPAPFGAVRKRTSISQSSLREPVVVAVDGYGVGGSGSIGESEVGLIAACSSTVTSPLPSPSLPPDARRAAEKRSSDSVERLAVERRIS